MSQNQSPSLSAHLHKQLLAGFDIFHPSRLATDDGVSIAVDILEGSLDNKSIGPIILCSIQPEHPYVFEFIISSVSEGGYKVISQHILDSLSSDAGEFRASLGHQVLSRLSQSLIRLPYPSEQKPERLDDRQHDIEIAPAVLEGIFKLLREGYLEKAEVDAKVNKKNRRHRGKTSRFGVTSGAHVEINERLFALGCEAPKDRDSAEEMIQSIILTQKNALEFFATLLRTPEVATLIRNSYFREHVLQGNFSISNEKIATPSAMVASSPLAHTADPIQADLYFESADGYGKWRILCSGPCRRDLARDGAQSNPVLRRLEELSLGLFSETNQKRLTKDSPIEIYRARLPGSARLVYHIDVIHEFGKNYETQVIRILGIYSMDELNRKDWEEVGKYRARKGPGYIERCRARICRRGVYYDPVTFNVISAPIGTLFEKAESLEDVGVDGVDEIHRLFDLEQYVILSQNAIRDILENNDYPQVFQVSHEEKNVIECTRSSFVLGRSGTGKTTVIVFKIFGIERAWQNQGCVGPRPRQLFITKSRLLAEKVERDYVRLLYSLSAGPDAPLYVRERIQHWDARRKKAIFDPDDTEGKRDDLPAKFSELRDSDFPLFLTMETLSSLLEADMKVTKPAASGPYRSRNSRSKKKDQEWARNGRSDLVTYDVFKRVYWPRLPRSSTKGVSPSLAFSEFIGTIKGSEKALDYPDRTLDRKAFETLRNTYEVDYSLFEAYQNLKHRHGERDLADRTHALLHGLKQNGLRGELVDFIYVDEVQDLLLIDTRLIISLCRNPDGLLWAGDTAQTISIGSTFTFKQLGASVYRYQRSIQALRGTPRQPEGFQLLTNYRSHGGIVECANVFIQLLQRFPGAIDLLRPEAGVPGKELPKFFHSNGLPQGREFFLSTSGILSKLGPNQCIIVRDDAARKSFKTEIGRVGVTLTMFNSKGLEYDDVILYNFFEDSAPDTLWKDLTNEDQHKLKDSKYAPLIRELKCLYVAITRAKHRLWIVDYSNTCEPIMRFLLNRNLVVEPPATRYPLEPFANGHNESNSDEWSEQGNRLLNHREYEEATMAFYNAGDVYMAAVSTAYQSREVARDIPESEKRRRKEAFVNAARKFEDCARMRGADSEEESTHYAAAARCYAAIKYHQDAVGAFKLAKMFTEAASYAFNHNLLDTAVSIIREHEAEVDSQILDCIKEVARLSYLESKKLEKAADLFKDDEEEMMEFIVDHDLGATRAVILGRQGRYGEAVIQHLDEGEDSEALDLTLQHIGDVMRDIDAFDTVVEKFLWKYLSFGCRGWPESAKTPSDKILSLLEGIRCVSMDNREQKTIMLYVFRLILQDIKSTNTRNIFANHILCHESLKLDKAIKLLALDFLFDDMSTALDVSSQTRIVSSLEYFHEYSLLIKDAALDKTPWDSPWLSTLFQFEKYGEDIRIRPDTFLYEDYEIGIQSSSQSAKSLEPREPSAVSLSREKFLQCLRRVLSERLASRIRAKDSISSRVRLFDPCIELILHGTCRGEHSTSHELDEGWFNRRARFHLQNIMILDNLHAVDLVDDFPSRIKSKRRLLGRLENALNPLLYLSGSISTLNEDMIKEATDGLLTVKRWAFDVLYSLNPSREELQGAFLTNLCKAFTLGRLRKDGRTVDSCLYLIPSTYSRRQRHPRLIATLYPSGLKSYTLPSFLRFIDGSGNLAEGIKFFGYLVRERLPIDLAVLCSIVERLFGLTVMTERYRGDLHGVILPRSWILALWKDFVTFKDKQLAPLQGLTQSTERLLKDVYTGEYLRDTIVNSESHGWSDRKNKVDNFSKDLPWKYVQDLCIARLCRCLCLLGENVPSLRDYVVRTMESFGRARRPESTAFHWRYISSRNWSSIAQVLYRTTPLQFDQLVRLHQRVFPILSPHPPSVQLVSFENLLDIPERLRSHSMYHRDYHPREIDNSTASHADSGSPVMTIGLASAAHGTDSPDDIPGGDQQNTGELAEHTAQDAVDVRDGEETDKTKEARIIQKAARRYLLKRTQADIEENSNDALTKGRNRLFKSFKASAKAIHVKYRKLYLGPVPHLLLCLEWTITRAQDSMNSIKARRGRVEVTLSEKSDLIAQHKLLRKILSDACNLQRRVHPESNLHPKASLDGDWNYEWHLKSLRSVVTNTKDLFERLEDPEAPSDEFELAWNGIMPSRLRKAKGSD